MIRRFVAIGHVDTGKSCLCGHLLYKCNYITEHDMNNIKRKAKQDKMSGWAWSRILDIYFEEQSRGKTHFSKNVRFEKDKKEYELIDTPGHKGFIREMISGISKDVNIAILLLSMKNNEFDASFGNGTLKEHLFLARAVGIEHLIIIGNKMDIVDWDEKHYMEKVKKVKKYIKKKLRWDMSKIYDIPISALNGIGLIDKIDMPEWYCGPSFLECLDQIPSYTSPLSNRKMVQTNTCKIRLMIVNCENIITAGYNCIAHFDDVYESAEIEQIKKKSFAREGDIVDCIITLKYKHNLGIGTRMIIRKKELSVGFGKIIGLSE